MVYLHSWNGTRAHPTLTPADILPLRIPHIGAVYCTLLQLLTRKFLTLIYVTRNADTFDCLLYVTVTADTLGSSTLWAYDSPQRVFPCQHILQLIKRIIFKLSKTDLLFRFCKIRLQNIYFWHKNVSFYLLQYFLRFSLTFK